MQGAHHQSIKAINKVNIDKSNHNFFRLPSVIIWLLYSLQPFEFASEALASEVNSPLDALFSKEQKQKGSRLFTQHCMRCHSAAQASDFIYSRWLDKDVDVFVDSLSKTMPMEGLKLQAQEYLDITAFLLHNLSIKDGLRSTLFTQQTWRKVKIQSPSLLVDAKGRLGDTSNKNWSSYRGSTLSQGYSSASQINRSNVDKLKIAWRWSSQNIGPLPELKNITTPLMLDGTLYFTAGLTRNVIAIDATTGQTLWMWRPREQQRYKTAPRKGAGRGVSYWQDEEGRGRILTVTPGFQLVALDAATGLPVSTFGNKGVVDLRHGLRLAAGRDLDIGSSSPPLVMGDIVVVGPAHQPGTWAKSKSNVKGDVRAYSVRTGKHLWTFNTIPQMSHLPSTNWQEKSNTYTGNAGVWAPMSGDPELGLIYLPVESPTNDYYGGFRKGDNRYANSLVCLDAKTGKLRWHFQLTHHDIWDWDLPAAPILIDIPREAGTIKAVVQITKQAVAYVFNRETGKPLWPIEERAVPQSDIAGELTSPTQPFPTKPLPYDRQGFTPDDLIDFTPEIRAAAAKVIEPYRLGEIYAVASLANAADGSKGTLTLPASIGGANWEGGVVDPETGMLYVGSMTLPMVLALEPAPKEYDSGYVGAISYPRVEGLPIVKPPWGRISAIDLKEGELVWMKPNGEAPQNVKNHPMLKGVDLGRTGKETRSGLLVTKTLLFAGEGAGGAPVLRAHDKVTGDILAEIVLPATQVGLPMSYVWENKQYIVMAVGDGEKPAEIVALRLPSSSQK